MKKIAILFTIISIVFNTGAGAQTIPNSGMETWINHGQYDDPQSWDTPNKYVCFIPYYVKVVTKSSDHNNGSLSARLESKTIPLMGVTAPGVVTLGSLVVDLVNQTYGVVGGVPVTDAPTHLKGYFKYQPKEGDSCAIGVVLTKWNGTGRDTLGTGYFSTKDTVTSWTHFSAWIDYSIQAIPDTMNIIALSSASFTPSAGTVLFIDDLYMDYTLSVEQKDNSREIKVINDDELKELTVFMEFAKPEECSVRLLNVMGQELYRHPSGKIAEGKVRISYGNFRPGLYILEILHGDKKYAKKLMLNS